MKILYVVPYVPNPIRVRPFNLIRSLAGRGHQITLATICNQSSARDELNLIEHYTIDTLVKTMYQWETIWNLAKALPTQVPLQANYSWSSEFGDRINQHVLKREIQRNGFDVVHIEHLRGSRYGLWLKSFIRMTELNIPVVWDSVDCISALFSQTTMSSSRLMNRWIARLELNRTERFESELASIFDKTIVTSGRDRDAFISLQSETASSKNIDIIANGVDLDYFKPDIDTRRDANAIVMTGKMSYHANVTMVMNFVEGTFKQILRKAPEVQLWIVGKDPPKSVKGLSEHPNIQVTGTVPDIRPFLAKAAVAVVPLKYGMGIQNKVLEALAMGTPVVATQNAVEALEVVEGRDLIVASEGVMDEMVVNLLRDESRRDVLGRAGRKYVERSHRWDHIAGELEDIYREVIHE
jgi:sugar transferase (PEP-CTERM/EpsH1 system associated)